MQQHVEYGTTFDAAMMGEIIEIERNLKALKLNVEKNGIETTFFFRGEALLNFIRLCCTFFGKIILITRDVRDQLFLDPVPVIFFGPGGRDRDRG